MPQSPEILGNLWLSYSPTCVPAHMSHTVPWTSRRTSHKVSASINFHQIPYCMGIQPNKHDRSCGIHPQTRAAFDWHSFGLLFSNTSLSCWWDFTLFSWEQLCTINPWSILRPNRQPSLFHFTQKPNLAAQFSNLECLVCCHPLTLWILCHPISQQSNTLPTEHAPSQTSSHTHI